MKIESLVEENDKDADTSAPSPGSFSPTPEFELLSEWVGLGAATLRNNVAGVEQYQRALRALGETERRLSELDHWHESPAFTEREKTALALSETMSSKKPAEFSLLTLNAARSHFSPEESLRLALAVMAANDWIDFDEKRTELTFRGPA
jgi:alkylhydroperoxidase family enzyme